MSMLKCWCQTEPLLWQVTQNLLCTAKQTRSFKVSELSLYQSLTDLQAVPGGMPCRVWRSPPPHWSQMAKSRLRYYSTFFPCWVKSKHLWKQGKRTPYYLMQGAPWSCFPNRNWDRCVLDQRFQDKDKDLSDMISAVTAFSHCTFNKWQTKGFSASPSITKSQRCNQLLKCVQYVTSFQDLDRSLQMVLVMLRNLSPVWHLWPGFQDRLLNFSVLIGNNVQNSV